MAQSTSSPQGDNNARDAISGNNKELQANNDKADNKQNNKDIDNAIHDEVNLDYEKKHMKPDRVNTAKSRTSGKLTENSTNSSTNNYSDVPSRVKTTERQKSGRLKISDTTTEQHVLSKSQNTNENISQSTTGDNSDRKSKNDIRTLQHPEMKDNPVNRAADKKHYTQTKENNVKHEIDNDEFHSTDVWYTDSETTGGKSSVNNNSFTKKKKNDQKKPLDSPKSLRSSKSGKSILKTEESKTIRQPFGFLALMTEEKTHRQTTRGSNENSTVSLPALNTHTEINKVYVEDTEKLVNKYPKRDKDYKLQFVYDIRPKYPSWYSPEKKLSRREKQVFRDINGVYADYKTHDERENTNALRKEKRIKQVEEIKKEESKEKRNKKLETALEQYEQLKEVREKFEILSWYRNQTQYITPRVLEHEKLSRHVYGLPESLEHCEKTIKKLRRKTKKRPRFSDNKVISQ